MLNRNERKSRLAQLRVGASQLIDRTIEEIKEKYEDEKTPISERAARAIAPVVEEGTVTADIARARLDFDFFCQHLNPIFKPALHHSVWNNALITEQSNEYLHRIAGQNISILAPRGGAKSTKLGLFCAWAIGIHAEVHKALQILYISANRELALAKCGTIRNILDTPKYQEIFPFVQPNPKQWSNSNWSIDRQAAGIEATGQEEFTMICAGILGTIASKRCHIVSYDDLVKNAEDIENPAVRRKIPRTHYSVVVPTLFPGGRIVAINTRYRPDDVHVSDFIPSKGWNVLEQSAIIPRRELLHLGKFKAGLSNAKFLNTEALDESEALAIAAEEEAQLIFNQSDVEGKGTGQTSESTVGKAASYSISQGGGNNSIDATETTETAGSINSNLTAESNIQYQKLQSLVTDYGIELRPIESFKDENDYEEYMDAEVSYWETMWPLSYLQERRNADPASFTYQYQNKVEQAAGMGIPPEHIHYGRPPMHFDYLCIGCDLATSKKRAADYTVFTLVGKLDQEYWVLDYWRGKVTGNLPKINHILDLYWNWEEGDNGVVTPWRIAVEKVAYQASLADDLTRELHNKYGLYQLVVMPMQMKGDKLAHVESVSGAFANGLVKFNEGIEWASHVKELQGLGAHDDCVDSLVIALQCLGVRKRLAVADEEELLKKAEAQRNLNYGDYNPYYGQWY